MVAITESFSAGERPGARSTASRFWYSRMRRPV